MCDELIEAWQTNNRINLLLIDRISAAGMKCTLSTRGGRGVAGEFAHIHNNRVWHVEKRAKDLAAGLSTFPTGAIREGRGYPPVSPLIKGGPGVASRLSSARFPPRGFIGTSAESE